MRNDAKVDDFRFPLDLGAPAGSLEAKAPHIDNGLDIPHPARYYSREFMQKEWLHLWPRVWLLAAATSDVAEPGDFTLFQHGHEEIIVVRQEDATIKAFFNACPHRGNRVCQVDRGSASSFTCAFHSWEFGCDGKLQKIVDEEKGAASEGVDGIAGRVPRELRDGQNECRAAYAQRVDVELENRC